MGRLPRKKRSVTLIRNHSEEYLANLHVDFHEYDRPIGKNRFKFASYRGVTTRKMISILVKSWDVVDECDKDQLWLNIKEIRRKGSETAKQNKNHPRLGSSGYRGMESKWDEEVNYGVTIKAHKIQSKRARYFIFARRKHLGIEFSQGDFSGSRYDVLTEVIGPEHPGRTRGVGDNIGLKQSKIFNRKKKTQEQQMKEKLEESMINDSFYDKMKDKLLADIVDKIVLVVVTAVMQHMEVTNVSTIVGSKTSTTVLDELHNIIDATDCELMLPYGTVRLSRNCLSFCRWAHSFSSLRSRSPDKPQNMMVYPVIALKGKMVTNPNATAIYHLWLCNSVITDMLMDPTKGVSNGIRAVGPGERISWDRFDKVTEDLRQSQAELLRLTKLLLEKTKFLTGSRREEEEEAVGHDSSFSPSLMAFPSVVRPTSASVNNTPMALPLLERLSLPPPSLAPLLSPQTSQPVSPPSLGYKNKREDATVDIREAVKNSMVEEEQGQKATITEPKMAPEPKRNGLIPSSQPQTQLSPLPVPPSQLSSQNPLPSPLESSFEAKNVEKMSLWKRSTEKFSLHSTIAAAVALDNRYKPTPSHPSPTSPPSPPPPDPPPPTPAIKISFLQETKYQRSVSEMTAPLNGVTGNLFLGYYKNTFKPEKWAAISNLGSLKADKNMDLMGNVFHLSPYLTKSATTLKGKLNPRVSKLTISLSRTSTSPLSFNAPVTTSFFSLTPIILVSKSFKLDPTTLAFDGFLSFKTSIHPPPTSFYKFTTPKQVHSILLEISTTREIRGGFSHAQRSRKDYNIFGETYSKIEWLDPTAVVEVTAGIIFLHMMVESEEISTKGIQHINTEEVDNLDKGILAFVTEQQKGDAKTPHEKEEMELSIHHLESSLGQSKGTMEGYKAEAHKTKEHALTSGIFKIILTQRSERRSRTDPVENFKALRAVNPSPYVTYLLARGGIKTPCKKRKFENVDTKDKRFENAMEVEKTPREVPGSNYKYLQPSVIIREDRKVDEVVKMKMAIEHVNEYYTTKVGVKFEKTEGQQLKQETRKEIFKGFSFYGIETMMLHLPWGLPLGYHSFLMPHLNRSTRGTYPIIHLEDKVKVWADGIDKPQNMMVYPVIALKGKMVTNPNATAIYHLWVYHHLKVSIDLIYGNHQSFILTVSPGEEVHSLGDALHSVIQWPRDSIIGANLGFSFCIKTSMTK
ncbi:hypothetical protein LXL04_024042 [Taraxacum kok-saghyz]